MKTKELKIKIYELMDSFLTEAKEQDGNDRSLDRLNLDRGLFAKNMLEVLDDQRQEIINEIAQYSGINDIQTKELIKIIKKL